MEWTIHPYIGSDTREYIDRLSETKLMRLGYRENVILKTVPFRPQRGFFHTIFGSYIHSTCVNRSVTYEEERVRTNDGKIIALD